MLVFLAGFALMTIAGWLIDYRLGMFVLGITLAVLGYAYGRSE